VFRLKEENKWRHTLSGLVGLVWATSLLLGTTAPVWALGTAAGTVIANTATATYTIGADPTPKTVTAMDSFEVLEVINTIVVWQDAADVTVNTPQTERPLTFLLTNTGNGPEAFTFAYNDALGSDDFDPLAQSIWLESNGQPGLQTTGSPADTVLGAATPDLPPDGSLLIYLLSNIPSGLGDGQTGRVSLTAAAATPGAAGAAAGTELPGAGLNGGSAVVGNSNGHSEAIGTYVVAAVNVQLTKSIAAIEDLSGGNEPYPGARVTYRLTVQIGGSGAAEALTIVDVIPADTTYVAGSIVLDGTPQTDAADAPADHTDFNVTSADTVTVELQDTVAPATHTIEFTTTIN